MYSDISTVFIRMLIKAGCDEFSVFSAGFTTIKLSNVDKRSINLFIFNSN